MTLDEFREKTKDMPGSHKLKLWVQNAPSGMSRAVIDKIETDRDGVHANVYFLGDDQEW